MEAVKIGWSWPGFFFGYLWALFKRLYLFALAAFLVLLALRLGREMSAEPLAGRLALLSGVASVGLNLLFGLKGNDWRDAALRRRRFRFRTVVRARTPATAVQGYFEQALQGRGE